MAYVHSTGKSPKDNIDHVWDEIMVEIYWDGKALCYASETQLINTNSKSAFHVLMSFLMHFVIWVPYQYSKQVRLVIIPVLEIE